MKLEISDWVLVLVGLAALTYFFGGRLWLWWKDGGFVVDGQKKKQRRRRTRLNPRATESIDSSCSQVPPLQYERHTEHREPAAQESNDHPHHEVPVPKRTDHRAEEWGET